MPIFDAIAQQLPLRHTSETAPPSRSSGRFYRCQCGRPVFFNNTFCLNCQATLGFVPTIAKLSAFQPTASAHQWALNLPEPEAEGLPVQWRRCANFDTPAGCNWMVPADSSATFCSACRLNRVIPNLSVPENGVLWSRLEAAKRRLIAQLLELGLPVASLEDDPARGVAFAFLANEPGAPPILTGHSRGLITINIEEADDAARERLRHAMREPYRTLLGHFRHEIGHYYWDRLIDGTPWLEKFRAVFGDERADYTAALQRNYEFGPVPDWALQHVSAYASVHPWEDWAETWAHYLHLVDTLHTALGFGLDGSVVEFQSDPFTSDALYEPTHPGAARFLTLLNSWIELTAVLNELVRSMGQPDLYPFVLSQAAVAKLHFVHLVVEDAAQSAVAP